MYKISLSMIVKNEEKFLEGCLLSVKDVVDEIILVDTGSTDNTIEIAKKYGAKIFHFDWVNDFSAARNYALKNSSGKWILYLDADERLSPDSINYIKNLKNEVPDKAYECTITNIERVNGRPSTMLYTRVFPNKPMIKFEGKIHEQIENSLIKNKIQVVKSGIRIIHHGYDLNEDAKVKKAERNLKILQAEFNSNPSSYYAYQLGQTYGILNLPDEAVKYFLIALKDPVLRNEYKSVAFRFIALVYAEKNLFEQALTFINKSLKYDDKQPLALLGAAGINLKMNNKDEVLRLCKKAVECNTEYLQNKRSSSQAILLDGKNLFYEVMNLVNSLKDKANVNNFLNYFTEKIDPEFSIELEALKKLVNNEALPEKLLSEWLERIDKKNAGIISAFMLSYSYSGKLLEIFLKKFYNDVNILKLISSKFKNETSSSVEDLLQRTFELDTSDGSLVFFLVTLKIRNNKLTEILPIIKKAETNFRGKPEVLSRIHEMKRKLIPLL